MLVPRYYYANTYDDFSEWLSEKPHEKRIYKKTISCSATVNQYRISSLSLRALPR